MSIRDEIHGYLGGVQHATLDDLVGKIEGTKNTLRQALMQMTKDGEIRRIERGVYAALERKNKRATKKETAEKVTPEKIIVEKPEANRNGAEPVDDAFLYLAKVRILVLAQDENDVHVQLHQMLEKLNVQDYKIGKVKQAEEAEIAVRLR